MYFDRDQHQRLKCLLIIFETFVLIFARFFLEMPQYYQVYADQKGLCFAESSFAIANTAYLWQEGLALSAVL